jgi:hypothetical protein
MNLKLSTVAAAIVATVISSAAIATSPPALINTHSGMCDASAAIPVGSDLFVVANDEDNILRFYKRGESGASVYASQDFSEFLKINPKKKNKEADIEGATLIGNRIYWIASHGTNSDGDARPNRLRFFATDIEKNGDKFNLQAVGTPFLGLVQALADSAQLKDYHLGDAAKQATKSAEGLNIEGLTRTPEGTLLIGFRSPFYDKKALLVPLENPDAVIAGNEKPTLGQPILLDLEGLGIRSIEYSDVKKAYFIIAGPYDKTGDFQLYQWAGNTSKAELIKGVDFQGLNPEALIVYPEEKTRIQILSDDGEEKLKDKKCKKLKNPLDQSFRSLWITIN